MLRFSPIHDNHLISSSFHIVVTGECKQFSSCERKFYKDSFGKSILSSYQTYEGNCWMFHAEDYSKKMAINKSLL